MVGVLSCGVFLAMALLPTLEAAAGGGEPNAVLVPLSFVVPSPTAVFSLLLRLLLLVVFVVVRVDDDDNAVPCSLSPFPSSLLLLLLLFLLPNAHDATVMTGIVKVVKTPPIITVACPMVLNDLNASLKP